MKLLKKIRKGFTLIELVVVIAVIAILAAVSIVSYVSITNKAKQSNDQQKIDQVNLSLQAAEISKKPSTMYEALEAVEADGFLVENFKAEAKNYEFAYSLEENRFLILDGEKVAYPKEYTSLSKSADIWRFSDAAGTLNDGFSHYLLESASGAVTSNAGVDVGKNDDISSIAYSSAVAQSVVFRTNGGTLTVDGANSHVEHHGLLNVGEITKVSPTTYVEHGSVAKLVISADAPSVVLEKTAVVVQLENNNPTVEVTNKGYIVEVSGTAASVVEDKESSGAIKVVDYYQLQSLALASSSQGFDFSDVSIEIVNDIDIAGREWIPFGFDLNHKFSGKIDGKNHKITGLGSTDVSKLPIWQTSAGTSGYSYGLIAHAQGNVEISNLSIDISFNDLTKSCGVAAFIGCYHNDQVENGMVNLTNLKVSGSIVGQDKVGSFIGSTYKTAQAELKTTIVFDACVSSANLSSPNRVGGLAGTACTKTTTGSITVTRSSYSGTIVWDNNGPATQSYAAGAAFGVVPGGNKGSIDLSGFTTTSSLSLIGWGA